MIFGKCILRVLQFLPASNSTHASCLPANAHEVCTMLQPWPSDLTSDLKLNHTQNMEFQITEYLKIIQGNGGERTHE